MASPEDLNTIGKRLRHARTLRGLGSRELARRAHLKSESHVSLIEGGREQIAADVALGLARALEVPMEWLVAGGGDAPELTAFPKAPHDSDPPPPDDDVPTDPDDTEAGLREGEPASDGGSP